MKKIVKSVTIAIVTAVMLSFSSNVKSQTIPAHAFVVSLGFASGLPTGMARGGTVFTMGGDVRLHYGLTDNFAVTFTTGGYHFFPKYIPGESIRYGSYGIGPVKFGVKYFFVPHLYVAGEAGMGVEVTDHFFHGGQTKLLLSPGVGYATTHWDFGVRYENYSGENNDYGQVAMRIAYGFKL